MSYNFYVKAESFFIDATHLREIIAAFDGNADVADVSVVSELKSCLREYDAWSFRHDETGNIVQIYLSSDED